MLHSVVEAKSWTLNTAKKCFTRAKAEWLFISWDQESPKQSKQFFRPALISISLSCSCCVGSWELHSPLKAPEANSLQEFLHTEGQSYMQATYLLPEKPELRMGLGRELVELDSALVPISSTLVCGVRHTPKPFHLTRTVIMLLLEPKHARWGSSLTWQSVGLGTKHKVVGPCCQQRPFFRTTPGRKKHGDFISGQLFIVLPHRLVQERQPYLQKDAALWQRHTHSGYFTFDQDTFGLFEKKWWFTLQRACTFCLS